MIKLAHNTIENRDYELMIKFLKRSYLNQSKITKKFEENFSKKIGTKYSIFVNSGSSANLLIAQTLLEGNFVKNKTIIVLQCHGQLPWSFLQLGFKLFCVTAI